MNPFDFAFAILWASVFTAFVIWFMTEVEQAVTSAGSGQMDQTSKSLGELYIGLSPEAFFALRLLLTILGFTTGFLMVNTVAGAMLGAFCFIVPTIVLKRLREKRVRLLETQLVEGLELLANSLKSGLTLPQAIELLVREFPKPISQEFSLLLAETRLGVEFNDALRNMANRLGSTIYQILATGIAVTKRCGGDLTVIFANIAQTIREQAVIEGKLDAVTAQGRFQGLVLSIMPFALIIILWFVDRSHVETLFGYTLGVWAIGIVILFVFLAQLWISRLLKIDV